MNKLLVATLLGAIAFSAPLHAKVRTYEATINVTGIDRQGEAQDSVRDQNGILHVPGDRIVARFSFDDAPLVAASAVTAGGGGEFRASGPGTLDLSFHNGAEILPTLSAGWEAFRIGGSSDMFFFDANEPRDANYTKHQYRLALFGAFDDTPPEGLPWPYSLDLAHFSRGGELRMIWADDISFVFVEGKFGSLVEVSPVPEPASYGMLLVGLGALGALARRSDRPRGAFRI